MLLIGGKRSEEMRDLACAWAKHRKNALTVFAEGLALNETGWKNVRVQKCEVYDVVVFAPRACEALGSKAAKTEFARALTMTKTHPQSCVVMCVLSSTDTNPVSLRVKMFGHGPPSGDEIRGAFGEEEMFQVLESLGFADCECEPLACKVNISGFLKATPNGINEVAEWLRVTPETCKNAAAGEITQLRRLCLKGTDDIAQPKSVYCINTPVSFERDNRAQPNPRAWWPDGDRINFYDHGLETWKALRERWVMDGSTVCGPPAHPGRVAIKVPKLSSRELNDLIETLASNHERIELPGPMRLQDTLDLLCDVWESIDD